MKYKHQLLVFICLLITFNFFIKLNSLKDISSNSISDYRIDLNSQLKDIEIANSRLEKEILKELKSNEALETTIHNKYESNITDMFDILDEESNNTDKDNTGLIKFIEKQGKMRKLNNIKRTNKTKIKQIHDTENNKDARIINNSNIKNNNNNNINSNDNLIFEVNNDLDTKNIKSYIDDIIKNNKKEIKFKQNDFEKCEVFHSVIYILKQTKLLLAKRMLINSEKIIIYSNSDKEASKIQIELNLISSIKLLDDCDNMSLKEKCFRINYYSLEFKSSIEEIVLCNSSIYFSNISNSDNIKNIRDISGISEEFDKNFLIKQILRHKNCKYSEQLLTQPAFLNNSNFIKNNIDNKNSTVLDNFLSMKGEIEEINMKKKIQEKYISEISTLFEESDTELKALKRDFIQKLNDIKIHNKEEEIKQREIMQKEKNNHDIDHEITELTGDLESSDSSNNQINNNNSEEIKQLESLIKEVKGKIISSKIEKIESMRKRFNAIIEQNEFEAMIKAKKFLAELNYESKLVVENKCGDSTVAKDIVCSELFGLSGKEECLSDGYFCNRCCGFYIGSKFKKQLSECLVKCKSQREKKENN